MDTRAAIRVLVADDHPLMREGLCAVINGATDLVVAAEARNGREAIEHFVQHRPDVTLMDLQMPQMDGVEATAAIRSISSDARVVMLTTYKGDVQAMRALKAGASGYLLKNVAPAELLGALRAVHAGERRIAGEVACELAAHVTDEMLSPKELAVLRQVAAGHSNRRVAALLGLSEETVKSHMKNVMGKLSARDRTHAVAIALRRGILDTS